MTQANKLTLLRLALVPGFMVFMFFDHLWTRVAALIIFIIASITDLYDGKIARRTGTVTVIGTFLDPLVDKMLIAAALVGFVELGELHIRAWMVVLIISREFLITGLRSLAASRGVVMAAEGAGKFKMASQITAIITIMVILIANSVFERWPGIAPNAPDGWQLLVRQILERTPFWLVFWTAILTVVSGIFYIHKYSDLLKTEFAMLKTTKPSVP
jgi:CDP-diacylglycerol--glycerol-3-phosphate 3-phosphatidyltransferase